MAATRLTHTRGLRLGAGGCRDQKTPPTEPRLRQRSASASCGSGLGRDAADAVRRLVCRLLSRSEDPSHRTAAPTATGERFLWKRPWPRRGRCSKQASIEAAVGVRRPLPQNAGSNSNRRVLPVGAALAATRLTPTAGFVSGICRAQETAFANLANPARAAARMPLPAVPRVLRSARRSPASVRSRVG